MSNHVTFADPLFIFFRHLPVIVTAHENLTMPVAGAIMKAMQVIAVNRDLPDSRRNASGAIKRKAMCNDWSHVMIFPEATTTNGKALVSFKAGAFTPGYAVQPMLMRYPHVHIDPSWVAEGPVVYWLLFRLMTQFHNFMSVSSSFLPCHHHRPFTFFSLTRDFLCQEAAAGCRPNPAESKSSLPVPESANL